MRPTLTGALLVVGLLAASCSGGGTTPGPAPVKGGRAVTFVSLGDDETAGGDLDFPAVLQRRWTEVLYHDSLPIRAVHLNLARVHRGVEAGLTDQLPLALVEHPTIATIWFGRTDGELATPVDRFREDLEAMVNRLEAAGAAVFVATDTGTRYDAATTEAVEATHATAVSMAGIETAPLGVAGHAEVAKRMATAIGTVR